MARRGAAARTRTAVVGLRNPPRGQLELGSRARSSRLCERPQLGRLQMDRALTLLRAHTAAPVSQV